MTHARRVYTDDSLTLYEGQAHTWPGTEAIDLVLTNPYGPMPWSLRNHPMLIHQWVHRRSEAARWAANPLSFCVGTWNIGREGFWTSNIDAPVKVDLSEFVPEPEGWYPEALVERLLAQYGKSGMTIWDGFMGRGTVAKVARAMGMKYVGVEELPKHLAIAASYLEITL